MKNLSILSIILLSILFFGCKKDNEVLESIQNSSIYSSYKHSRILGKQIPNKNSINDNCKFYLYEPYYYI